MLVSEGTDQDALELISIVHQPAPSGTSRREPVRPHLAAGITTHCYLA